MRPFVLLMALVGSLIASDVFAQCRGCRSSVIVPRRAFIGGGFATPVRNFFAGIGARAAIRQGNRAAFRQAAFLNQAQFLNRGAFIAPQRQFFFANQRQFIAVPQSFGFVAPQQQFFLNAPGVRLRIGGGCGF